MTPSLLSGAVVSTMSARARAFAGSFARRSSCSELQLSILIRGVQLDGGGQFLECLLEIRDSSELQIGKSHIDSGRRDRSGRFERRA